MRRSGSTTVDTKRGFQSWQENAKDFVFRVGIPRTAEGRGDIWGRPSCLVAVLGGLGALTSLAALGWCAVGS